jgi:hypothetical protein
MSYLEERTESLWELVPPWHTVGSSKPLVEATKKRPSSPPIHLICKWGKGEESSLLEKTPWRRENGLLCSVGTSRICRDSVITLILYRPNV